MTYNDPYIDEKSGTLKNKLGIKDKYELQQAEQKLYIRKASELFEFNNIEINNKEDYKNIHKFFFDELYDWAGENRLIDISKSEPKLYGDSITYSHHNEIDNDLNRIFDKYSNINPSRMNKKQFEYHLKEFSSELWRVHPFREGNTRTVGAFTELYAKQNGFEFDLNKADINGKQYRDALVQNNAYRFDKADLIEEDKQPLKSIFEEALKETEQHRRYRKKFEKGREL